MSDPTTTNKIADIVNRAIRTLGDTSVQTVQNLIIADIPELGLPFVKQLWEIPFGLIASYFIKFAENGGTFVVIDMQTGAEKIGISKALAEIIAAEKSGDKNAIAKAIVDYQKAQSALVHDDGSAPAQ